MAVEVASLFVKIGADISGAVRGLNEVSSQVKQTGAHLINTGAKMTAFITAPIVAIGSKMLSSAAQFETAMNVMALAAKTSGTSMEDLKKAAIAVGADTELVGINAAQAAQAMTNFYKAGLKTNDIFGDMNAYMNEGASLSGALRAAIDMAAASEYDLAAASDAVTIAMATFGISADDATKITDSFVRAADASVASVPELADAMTNVGSSFAAFYANSQDGIETMDQLNVALALLSQRGIRGAEAGTALKSMFTNMMRPTDATQEALSKLNVSLYDQEGRLKTLPRLLGEFEEGLKGATEQERNQAIQAIAGTYGMKAMNTLLAEGAAGWAEMETQIANASDTQAAAGARTMGLGAAWENLMGVIETLVLTGTGPLMETITGWVRGVTELISKLNNLNPIVFKMIAIFAGVLVAIGPVVTIIGALVTAIGFLISPVGLVIAGIVALGVAFVRANGGIGPTLKRLQSAGKVIGGLFDLFKGRRDNAVWEWIAGGLLDIGVSFDKAKGLIDWIRNLTSAFDESLPGIQAWWTGVQEAFQEGGILAAIQEAFGSLDELGEALAPLREFLAGEITKAWESLKEKATEWAESAHASILATWEMLKEKVPEWGAAIWAAISEAFVTAWAFLSEKVPEWGSTIGTAFTTLWETLKENVPVWAERIQGSIEPAIIQAWAYLSEKVPEWAATVGGFFSSVWATLKEKVPEYAASIWETISGAFTTAWAFLSEKVPEWVSTIGTTISTTWETLKERAPEWGANLGQTLGEAVRSGIMWLVENIGPFVQNLWEGLRTLVTNAQQTFEENSEALGTGIGETLGKMMRTAILAFVGVVVTLGTLLWEAIKGIIDASTNDERTGNGVKAFLDFIKAVFNGFITGLTGDPQWAEKLKAWLDGVIKKALDNLKETAIGRSITMGIDLIEGLIEGVKQKAQDIIKSVEKVVGDALRAAKNLLGIKSPSTEFAEIGLNMMRGFANGIDLGKAKVAEKVSDAIKDIVQAFAAIADMCGLPPIPDVRKWADDFVAMAEVLVEAVSRIGYNESFIRKMKSNAVRIGDILRSMVVDLSAVKEYELPNLDAWANQIYAVSMKLINTVFDIKEKVGSSNAVKLAAEISKDISEVLKLLGADLTFNLGQATFFDDLPTFFDQVFAGFQGAYAVLMEIAGPGSDLTSDLVAAAGTLAKGVVDVLSLLGANMGLTLGGETFFSDLPTFFDQVYTGFQQAYAALMEIAGPGSDLTQEMVDAAASLAGPVKQVLDLLGANLDVGIITADWPARFAAWAAGMVIAADEMIYQLGVLRDTWGDEALEAAAATAKSINTVLGLLSFKLVDLEAPGQGFADELLGYVDAFKLAVVAMLDAFVALEEMGIGDELLARWDTYAKNLKVLWDGLEKSVKAINEIAGNPIDVAAVTTTLGQLREATAATSDVMAVTPAVPTAAQAAADGGAAGPNEGVLTIHLVQNERALQSLSVRIDDLRAFVEDMYVQMGLDGVVA